MMLEVANTLTAEDLEHIRSSAPTLRPAAKAKTPAAASTKMQGPPAKPKRVATSDASRGERERQRTRESKVSTTCVGAERTKHQWWPVGTELAGHIGGETFTATVVENPSVKSGRGVLITSGPSQGTVCITPTRAAIEATEAYRQANNLGRGGGVTNGWTFWKATSDQ